VWRPRLALMINLLVRIFLLVISPGSGIMQPGHQART
jgi:hypothetical protein